MFKFLRSRFHDETSFELVLMVPTASNLSAVISHQFFSGKTGSDDLEVETLVNYFNLTDFRGPRGGHTPM